jgi:hypothetical protein
MSDFITTGVPVSQLPRRRTIERSLIGSGARGSAMSITDQFWQYAKEAMLSADAAKTEENRQSMLELAGTWTQAALRARQRTLQVSSSSPSERGLSCLLTFL